MPNDIETLSSEWQSRTLSYVSRLNAWVEKNDAEGWENPGDEPEDNREELASQVLDQVRKANRDGTYETLRDRFAPGHGPFMSFLETNGTSLPFVSFLDNDQLILQRGTSYQEHDFVILDGEDVIPVRGMTSIGRSPDRRYFAIGDERGVTVRDGWNGDVTVSMKWPTGTEGIPAGFEVEALDAPPNVTQLIPFPDGRRCLLVSPEGCFVLSEGSTARLLPTVEQFTEHFEWSLKEYPDDPLSMSLSMEHGAVSANGKWIAAGHQDSNHLVFDEELELAADIGPMSSYPHFAVFSTDSSTLAINSCHFYNGITLAVSTSRFPGLLTEPYEEDSRVPTIEDRSRVYAAVHRNDEFIIGDAGGYLRAFDHNGNYRWHHFIGSSVGDIDLSPDGNRLVVSTYAGFVAILDLDRDSGDPYAIGDSMHRESRRWLFWKQEEHPLIW